MIFTRKEMHDYIHKDRERMPIAHPFLSAITFSESWSVRRYLTVLRHLEYHKNVLSLYRRFFVMKRKNKVLTLLLIGGGNLSFGIVFSILYFLET